MTEDGGESVVTEIAARLGKSQAHARVYKARLLEQGVIEEGRRGHVTFAFPHLRDYLVEQGS